MHGQAVMILQSYNYRGILQLNFQDAFFSRAFCSEQSPNIITSSHSNQNETGFLFQIGLVNMKLHFQDS
ncbi:hypothetical protein P8452_34699 [Trifolium repens]|nr:hypothetical protein P8452_34699 [Trifolium repens]